MTNKDYRLRKLLLQLNQMKKDGKKSVVWKLSKEQLDFLGKYFRIEPYLYVIRTKKFCRIHDVHDSLLKDIHYAHKNGKKEKVMKLNSKQKAMLKEYDVRFRPCKYLIVLR